MLIEYEPVTMYGRVKHAKRHRVTVTEQFQADKLT